MAKANSSMKMEIVLKETILKMRREERVSTISMRVESCNHNLIQTLRRYQKYIWQTGPCMWENRKMDLGKVQAKPLMWMVVFTMGNG